MSLLTILTFVKKNIETDDIYTFSFTSKRKLNHKAGQHGLFVLPGLYRPHPFSLSSSPEEDLITFSTHTATGSAFKNKLMKLEPGAKMLFVGPMLNFTFKKNETNYVFLAQGIGITPFRSMLVHAQSAKLPITTTLIHVDSKAHTFEPLTRQYATNALYPTNPEEFQNAVKMQPTDRQFYISGSPRFVSSTKQVLSEMGVARGNVKTDTFLGY